jgi:hypothetical protein
MPCLLNTAICRSVGVAWSQQLVQILRTSRWAMTMLNDEARMPLLTPRSSRRLMADAASLVCRVEKTRWPVMDARRARSAVSVSRISPTRMMSGSWRMADRRALPKERPALGLTAVWRMVGITYSMGSSTVMTLMLGLLIVISAE